MYKNRYSSMSAVPVNCLMCTARSGGFLFCLQAVPKTVSLRGLKGRGNPFTGSLKPATAIASGGILFCAHRKVRKRSVKGERAFYKDALSPLKSPYPPKSSANPIISIPAQCLLGNTVPIDFKHPTIPKLPAPERSMTVPYKQAWKYVPVRRGDYQSPVQTVAW